MNFKLLPIAAYYLLIFIVLSILVIIFKWYNIPFDTANESSFTYKTLTSFTAGLLLASTFFFLLRPHVKISNRISKRTDENNKVYYTFKFINNSIFSAFDVNIESYIGSKTNATANGEGVNVRLDMVKLTRNRWIYISRWKPAFESTEYAQHCITVRTFHDDLDTLISDNANYLEFRVTLKHAFSNLSSTYRMRYMSEDCVVKGKFEFGNSLKIV